MKVVKVYGALRERLGQCRFELNVATPAQAIKALCVNFPGLDKWLIDSEQDGVAYRVKVGKEEATPSDMSVLGLPWSEREVFSITPVVAGAGGGFGRAIFGGLLIGASFLFPGAGLFGKSAFGVFGPLAPGTIGTLTTVGTALSAVGAGLVLTGVSQIISPTPPSGLELKEANRIQNFSFSGITNTSQQGLAVPIAYGRLFVGSAVISSGLDVDHSPSSSVTEDYSSLLALFLRNKS
jgi:predicted phage tail protein|tara:strand:- start:965 stop:1675 length:711 start_codon:yes stop_codon:yes gene_type:complete